MPQLSLYLDEATLEMVEKAAKMSQVSVSKWIRNRLVQSLKRDWPEGYLDLYGAISDDTFTAPDPVALDADAPREKL